MGMLEENIPAKAAERGEYLMAKLRDVQDRNPVVGDVRGLGLMVATEFTDPVSGKPAGEHPSEQKNAKNHQKTRKRSLRGISLLKKLARDQTFKKFIAKSDATSMN